MPIFQCANLKGFMNQLGALGLLNKAGHEVKGIRENAPGNLAIM